MIMKLIDLRNATARQFGFKTTYQTEGFGPFDVKFRNDDDCEITYEEQNFIFYGEMKRTDEKIQSHFAVKFKSLKGRIYFFRSSLGIM